MATLTPEQVQQFAGQRLGLQGEAERSRRRLNEDYDIQSRMLGEQRERDVGSVADQMGSQGLYNSGIRINEQGQVERRANEQLSEMNLGRARGLEDVGFNLTRGLAGIDERERDSLAEAMRVEREEAMQRALLEAQTRVPVVQPPAYPNPVIPYLPPYAPSQPDPMVAYLNSIQKQREEAQYFASLAAQRPNNTSSTSYSVPKIQFGANGAPIRTPMNPRIIQRY